MLNPPLTNLLPLLFLRDSEVFQGISAGSVPFTVKGVSGQTANIFTVQNSAGTVLFAVDPSGNLSIAGTATITINQVVTGNLSLTGTLSVTSTSTLTGAVTTGSSLAVGGALTVTGLASLNNGATISGTTIVNNLTVNGTTDFGTITLRGFTAGSVLFYSAATGITQNNSAYFWDNTNVRLGVGTGATTPGTTLQVNRINTAGIFEVIDYGIVIQGDTLSQVHPGICFSISGNNPTKAKSSVIPYTSANGSGVGLGSSSAYASGVNSVPLWANFCGGMLLGGGTTPPSAALAATLVVTQNVVTSGIRGEMRINTAAHTGQTASTERIGFNYVTATIQWATGALTTQREWSLAAPTYAFVGASTITNAATFAISGAPIAGTNATITNAYALWVQGGITKFDGRVTNNQGADVASAGDLTLGTDGIVFEITGTTAINAITTAGWQNGTEITLLFTSTYSPAINHNTAGGAGTAVVLLSGSAAFGAVANSRIKLLLSEVGGTQAWRETGRIAP
jgi:hypothetical protein